MRIVHLLSLFTSVLQTRFLFSSLEEWLNQVWLHLTASISTKQLLNCSGSDHCTFHEMVACWWDVLQGTARSSKLGAGEGLGYTRTPGNPWGSLGQNLARRFWAGTPHKGSPPKTTMPCSIQRAVSFLSPPPLSNSFPAKEFGLCF